MDGRYVAESGHRNATIEDGSNRPEADIKKFSA